MLLIRDGKEAGRTARSPTGRRHEIKLPVHSSPLTFTTRTLSPLSWDPLLLTSRNAWHSFAACLKDLLDLQEGNAAATQRYTQI